MGHLCDAGRDQGITLSPGRLVVAVGPVAVRAVPSEGGAFGRSLCLSGRSWIKQGKVSELL